MRRDAVNTLDEGAIFMHELFLAYLRAGFTEDQALRIITAMLREQIGKYQGGGESAAT